MYGIAILWIVVFHGGAIDAIDYSFGMGGIATVVADVIGVGNVGVDIFLFLSGICLYFSFSGNSDFYVFIKKRLWRLVPSALIIYGVYWFVLYAVFADDFWGFVSRLTLMRFWMTGDQSIWFVSLILVLYFIYPYLYRFLFNGNAGVVRFAILVAAAFGVGISLKAASPELYGMVEIAITRIPVFVIGCWVGRYVYEKRKISHPTVFVVASVALTVLFFAVLDAGVLHGALRRYFYILGGISLCVVFSLAVDGLVAVFKGVGEAIERFFAFFGGFSLEWYLAHIMVNQALRLCPWYEEGSLPQYLAVMVVSCVIAWATMKLCAKIRPYVFGDAKKKTTL